MFFLFSVFPVLGLHRVLWGALSAKCFRKLGFLVSSCGFFPLSKVHQYISHCLGEQLLGLCPIRDLLLHLLVLRLGISKIIQIILLGTRGAFFLFVSEHLRILWNLRFQNFRSLNIQIWLVYSSLVRLACFRYLPWLRRRHLDIFDMLKLGSLKSLSSLGWYLGSLI